jgi:uncharacterized protein (DUF2147 family)
LAERLERLARNRSDRARENTGGWSSGWSASRVTARTEQQKETQELRAMLKNVVALGAALMLTMSPVLAKDLGIYQTSDRKMDFQLTTCGGGQDLCVKLLKARGKSATKQIKPYIGKLVVKNAKPAGKNTWKGVMRFGKFDLNGSMTLKPGKSFYLSGCVYLVVCEDITLIPAK